MKIIYGIKAIKKLTRPVVALGVFDGLHRGHRYILRAALKEARRIKGTSIVLTFFPHPQKQASLYSLKHRLRLIAELGIDVCIVVNFSPAFSKITAGDFISKVLIKKIGANFVCVGKNFCFGKKATGDYRLLASYAKKYNFRLKICSVLKSKGIAISSTAIRGLINSAKLKEAEELLGRRVSVLGTVIKGSRFAGKLGFPTANISAHHEIIPSRGIYAVRINFCARNYEGICYIGTRPTLCSGDKTVHIEAHIFDFHKNIYGQLIEVQFVKWIRSDKKFYSAKELSYQIQKDIISCRKILAKTR